MLLKRTYDTAVGRVIVSEQNSKIVRLSWAEEVENDRSPLLDEAVQQLEAYFDGKLTVFDLPVVFHCSRFQQSVCEQICRIPYGSTVTYGELADAMKSAAQPVGNACGGNPIAIIVPCHRVLGSKDIGGYSGLGGVETKIALLKIENAIPWLI